MDVWWFPIISYVKDLVHHPIETTIYNWLFGVPGMYIFYRDYFCHIASFWYHSTNPLQFSLTPVLPKNNTIPPQKKTNTQLVGGFNPVEK